jgi:hypothetical protein
MPCIGSVSFGDDRHSHAAHILSAIFCSSGPIAFVYIAVVASRAWPSHFCAMFNGTSEVTALMPNPCLTPLGLAQMPRGREIFAVAAGIIELHQARLRSWLGQVRCNGMLHFVASEDFM